MTSPLVEALKLTDRCSVQRAACNALAVYLQTEFDKLYNPLLPKTRVVVSETWPETGVNMPARAVSVIEAGNRLETHMTPEALSKTDISGGNRAEFVFSIKAITQPIQLDIWALHDATRDQLCADLDTILNRGPAYTLGVGRRLISDGVALRLNPMSGYEGITDYTTINGPRVVNDGNARQASEFRSMITAELDVMLTVKATTAKLALIKVQGLLDSSPYTIALKKDGAALVFDPAQSQL